MATMKLEIVTAERLVYSDEVDMVGATGVEGEMAILPNHAPLLTVLKPGELRVRKNGRDDGLAVSGGFLEVANNRVMVLADAAEHAEEIDEARAQAAVRRAEEALQQRGEEVELANALAALRRAQVRLRVARRRRHGAGVPPPPGVED